MRTKTILISATAIGIAAAATWWLQRVPPILVKVVEVQPGTVERTVANTRAGTVDACRRARMAPPVGGLITELPVTEGQQVKRGQLLLSLWNDDLKAELLLREREVTASRASAEAACIKSDEAARDAERLLSLRARKLVSEEDADKAQTQARASAADCEAALMQTSVMEGQVLKIQANIERTQLVAPFDGVIAEVRGEISEYVTPSPPGIPTPPAIDLIDNSCYQVKAPIDEVDMAAVTAGQPARITLDAFKDRRFPGTVSRVADYVQDYEKQARTVEVEVHFDQPEVLRELRAGLSADVEIILEQKDNALRIPTEAVLDQDQAYVFDPTAGRLHKRQLQLGLSNWSYSEVLSGLSAGELLVTSLEVDGLADGATARIRPDNEAE